MSTRERALYTDTGGELSLVTERGCLVEPGGESSLRFCAGYGYMFGVLFNTPKTRAFLRAALKRMELEASGKFRGRTSRPDGRPQKKLKERTA